MRLIPPLLAALLVLAAPAAAQRPIGPADVEPHLAALQAVADANGGNRAAGRPGEPATVAYIASTLTSLGWSVTQSRSASPTGRSALRRSCTTSWPAATS